MVNNDKLEARLQKLVDIGESGTDILHGELKNMMYETEQALAEYTDHENEQYDQTVDRLHLEGQLDALTEVYVMTYNLAFAINERTKKNEFSRPV
jgi:hypothetical protein